MVHRFRQLPPQIPHSVHGDIMSVLNLSIKKSKKKSITVFVWIYALYIITCNRSSVPNNLYILGIGT